MAGARDCLWRRAMVGEGRREEEGEIETKRGHGGEKADHILQSLRKQQQQLT